MPFQNPQADLSQSLILIVDDDYAMRTVLRNWLEQDGYRVVEAGSSTACLAAYREHHPDLVLLDVMMPGQDGFVCCEQLHHLSGGEYTPILIMTSLVDDQSIHKAFAHGASDYLIKPLQWNLLSHQLQRILTQSRHSRRLESENQQFSRLATLDSLTRIPNRRCFDEHLEAMWRQMIREEGWLAFILGDVDFFKAYNDAYGHLAGDRCLQAIARTLNQCCRRPLDLVARYGGEEFGIILPKTNLEGGLKVASFMEKTLQKLNLPHQGSAIADRVTMSFGVAALFPTKNNIPDMLLEVADRALYSAKEQGRARVFGTDTENLLKA